MMMMPPLERKSSMCYHRKHRGRQSGAIMELAGPSGAHFKRAAPLRGRWSPVSFCFDLPATGS